MSTYLQSAKPASQKAQSVAWTPVAPQVTGSTLQLRRTFPYRPVVNGTHRVVALENPRRSTTAALYDTASACSQHYIGCTAAARSRASSRINTYDGSVELLDVLSLRDVSHVHGAKLMSSRQDKAVMRSKPILPGDPL